MLWAGIVSRLKQENKKEELKMQFIQNVIDNIEKIVLLMLAAFIGGLVIFDRVSDYLEREPSGRPTQNFFEFEPMNPSETVDPSVNNSAVEPILQPAVAVEETIGLGDLFYLIAWVESKLEHQAIGDRGHAVGIVQIWPVVIDDVNRIIGYKKYTRRDRYNQARSREIFLIYLDHYGQDYQKKTGKELNPEILARIWNGGPFEDDPAWWKKTDRYWRKVKQLLEEEA